jgi:hypothetical protein
MQCGADVAQHAYAGVGGGLRPDGADDDVRDAAETTVRTSLRSEIARNTDTEVIGTHEYQAERGCLMTSQ